MKLNDEQISVYLRNVPEWKHVSGSLKKAFTFDSFPDAIAFVNAVADLAEHTNHHPDLNIRYKTVEVILTTHDKGGVTGKDFLLAEQIEKYRRQHMQ